MSQELLTFYENELYQIIRYHPDLKVFLRFLKKIKKKLKILIITLLNSNFMNSILILICRIIVDIIFFVSFWDENKFIFCLGLFCCFYSTLYLVDFVKSFINKEGDYYED